MSSSLLAGILAGSHRAIARAATLIDNGGLPIRELLKDLSRHGRRSIIAGITGSPGAGKSTLTAELIRRFRAMDKRVGVVAVDPSSPFSGGAVLGDRVRMGGFAADDGVFIRSVANRGHLGGISASTLDMCTLLEASGHDVILVETVGAGQDEVEIASVAQVTCVVLAPSQGDDIQALKAGLLEIADVFVLNKCDLEGIDQLEHSMRSFLSLGASADTPPPILRTNAISGDGVDLVAQTVLQLAAGDAMHARQVRVRESRLRRMYAARMMDGLDSKLVTQAACDVAGGISDPYTIIESWAGRSGGHEKESSS